MNFNLTEQELAAQQAARGFAENRLRPTVVERDEADQNRPISPLRKADDAITLDNSHMTVEEQMEFFMDLYNKQTCK